MALVSWSLGAKKPFPNTWRGTIEKAAKAVSEPLINFLLEGVLGVFLSMMINESNCTFVY
jgi:hypothetical protein